MCDEEVLVFQTNKSSSIQRFCLVQLPSQDLAVAAASKTVFNSFEGAPSPTTLVVQTRETSVQPPGVKIVCTGRPVPVSRCFCQVGTPCSQLQLV